MLFCSFCSFCLFRLLPVMLSTRSTRYLVSPCQLEQLFLVTAFNTDMLA